MAATKLYDALIVGGGPAGLAAALGLGRLRRSAIVFDSGAYRNAGITAMHTVPSRDGAHPDDFRAVARAQIEGKYTSVEFAAPGREIVRAARCEVGAGGEDGGYSGFEVADRDGGVWRGRKLVLATGSKDVLPSIDGYTENWPHHIYQCLGCDGFEEADRPAGVLGISHPHTEKFTLMAFSLSSDVTVLTNGEPVPDAESSPPELWRGVRTVRARGAKFDTRRIARLVNDGPPPEHGVTVEFEDGEKMRLAFLVHRPPTVNRAQALLDQLGVETKPAEQGGEVALKNMFGETNVSGCFVAGDTMSMMKQVTVAMADGVKTAGGVIQQLISEEGARALAVAESRERG